MIARALSPAAGHPRAALACVAWLLGGVLGPAAPEAAPPQTLRLLVVGDSTVAGYSRQGAQAGWAQFLPEYFDGSITVLNRAVGGQSARSFLDEGRWKAALAEKPDVVLIQFGHNDALAFGYGGTQDVLGGYRDCLVQYLESARRLGAAPILVTPMPMRTFDARGRLNDHLLRPFAEAVRRVATEQKAPVVDLYAMSFALFERLGPAACGQLGLVPDDFTHFNKLGAKGMCALVMKALPAADPRLSAALLPEPPAPSHSSSSSAGGR